MFENLGRSAAEVVTIHRWGDEDFRQRVDASALADLNRLHPDRGLVFVTAHLGCWELLAACAVRELDRKVSVVARAAVVQGLELLLARQRQSVGVRVIHRGRSGRDLMRFLIGGGVLGILADQDSKHGHGTIVDFFGRPALTALGPHQLAARTGSVTVAGFIVREPDGKRHRILISPPIEPARLPKSPEEREAAAREFTQRFTNEIEHIVRKYPDQWMWMNRRWKRGERAVREGWKPAR